MLEDIKPVELMNIDIGKYFWHVVIVALSALGNVEWLKNFVHPEHRRTYSVIGLVFVIVSATMQMTFVPNVITLWYNLITLGLAFTQFGHSALIKVPSAIVNKSLGVKNE